MKAPEQPKSSLEQFQTNRIKNIRNIIKNPNIFKILMKFDSAWDSMTSEEQNWLIAYTNSPESFDAPEVALYINRLLLNQLLPAKKEDFEISAFHGRIAEIQKLKQDTELKEICDTILEVISSKRRGSNHFELVKAVDQLFVNLKLYHSSTTDWIEGSKRDLKQQLESAKTAIGRCKIFKNFANKLIHTFKELPAQRFELLKNTLKLFVVRLEFQIDLLQIKGTSLPKKLWQSLPSFNHDQKKFNQARTALNTAAAKCRITVDTQKKLDKEKEKMQLGDPRLKSINTEIAQLSDTINSQRKMMEEAKKIMKDLLEANNAVKTDGNTMYSLYWTKGLNPEKQYNITKDSDGKPMPTDVKVASKQTRFHSP